MKVDRKKSLNSVPENDEWELTVISDNYIQCTSN